MRYSSCLHGQDTPTCREDSVHVLDELKEVEEDEQHDRASNGEAEGVVTGELMNTCRVTQNMWQVLNPLSHIIDQNYNVIYFGLTYLRC